MKLLLPAIVFRFAIAVLFLPCGSILVIGEEWQTTCRQIVAVVTPEWESTRGRLCTLETIGTKWVAIGEAFPVTVGKKGLGWGLGLHSPDRAGPIKNEGDKRAPAGVFRLESGFGTKSIKLRNFEYRRTTASDLWVDDPRSVYYNRWVDTKEGSVSRDWTSAEVLRRPDGIYDFAIVVGHNRDPVAAGRGSAIFIHAWFGEGLATIGCTAMERENVKTLLKWLDRDKRPVLVQVPGSELKLLSLPVEATVIRSALGESAVR